MRLNVGRLPDEYRAGLDGVLPVVSLANGISPSPLKNESPEATQAGIHRMEKHTHVYRSDRLRIQEAMRSGLYILIKVKPGK